MKKILLLFSFIFLFTGCIKYQELNNMAIITTMAIEKKEEKYLITLKETIPKKEENKVATEYKYYKGEGKNIEKALEDASNNCFRSMSS